MYHPLFHIFDKFAPASRAWFWCKFLSIFIIIIASVDKPFGKFKVKQEFSSWSPNDELAKTRVINPPVKLFNSAEIGSNLEFSLNKITIISFNFLIFSTTTL